MFLGQLTTYKIPANY